MKLEEKTNAAGRTAKTAVSTPAESATKSRAASRLVKDVVAVFPDKGARFVGCAPVRLDVMGGIAEYSGALVLSMPTGREACVAAQRRGGGAITIHTLRDASETRNGLAISLSRLYGPNGAVVTAKQGIAGLADWDHAAKCALYTVVELLREGVMGSDFEGLALAVGTSPPEAASPVPDAAIAGATVGAASRAFGANLEARRASEICRRVESDWMGWPVDVADAMCALLGEPRTLMQLRCNSHSVVGTTRLPEELTFIGLDCGGCGEDARIKYQRVRVAAFMGRLLVDRIIQHDGGSHSWWDGRLSQISVNDYVERFRDRIPTRLKGAEFLEKFGETGDTLTSIDPQCVYRIRSRTEHHIYEHARACQFVECLSRGIRTADASVLAEAGELMYASHWSYGQRCGLGDVRTDLMVNLIRKHGAQEGLFGAKISGRGRGGTVAVFMRDTDLAWAGVEKAVESFKAKAGHDAVVIRGSSPGVMVAGVQQL